MPKYRLENENLGSSNHLIPWRSYHVTGEGETIAEFMANCTIKAVDENGVTIETTDFDGTPGMIQDEILHRLGCDAKAYFGLSCLHCHGTGRILVKRPNQIDSLEFCPHCDKGVLK